jgi:hypothetical protein
MSLMAGLFEYQKPLGETVCRIALPASNPCRQQGGSFGRLTISGTPV